MVKLFCSIKLGQSPHCLNKQEQRDFSPRSQAHNLAIEQISILATYKISFWQFTIFHFSLANPYLVYLKSTQDWKIVFEKEKQ